MYQDRWNYLYILRSAFAIYRFLVSFDFHLATRDTLYRLKSVCVIHASILSYLDRDIGHHRKRRKRVLTRWLLSDSRN